MSESITEHPDVMQAELYTRAFCKCHVIFTSILVRLSLAQMFSEVVHPSSLEVEALFTAHTARYGTGISSFNTLTAEFNDNIRELISMPMHDHCACLTLH